MLSSTEPRGFSQAGLSLLRDKDYTGRIVLAGESGAKVSVSIVWGTGVSDRQIVRIDKLTADYARYPLSFKSPVDAANAKVDRIIPVREVVPQTIPTTASAAEPDQTPAGPGGRRRTDPPPSPNEPLFACASKEDATGDIILKVVIIFDVEQNMIIELTGASVKSQAAGQVMVGQPGDINSVEDPFHIIPKDFVISDASSAWNHTFPGNSLTVIRFKTK